MDIPTPTEIVVHEPPLRVLVVDDVASARAGLCAFLSLAPDINVIGQAADGVEALQQIAADMPDVVVMDIEMPRLNGLDATRHLREQGLPIWIVILSIAFERRKDALTAGADAFVHKGEPPGHLMSILEGFRPSHPKQEQAQNGVIDLPVMEPAVYVSDDEATPTPGGAKPDAEIDEESSVAAPESQFAQQPDEPTIQANLDKVVGQPDPPAAEPPAANANGAVRTNQETQI